MIPTWVQQYAEGAQGPIEPGPLDDILLFPGDLTNYSKEFPLASDCAVLGLACAYTGTVAPVVKYDGVTLTNVVFNQNQGVLALLAVGTGLTPSPNGILTIETATGTLDWGALRFNEMSNIQPGLTGWEGGGTGSGSPIPQYTMTATSGGIAKAAFANKAADRYHEDYIQGMTAVFDGFFMGGTPIPEDTSTSGAWSLGTGWAIVGNDFVHTGATSGTLNLNFAPSGSPSATRAFVEVGANGNLKVGTSSSLDTYGPGAKGLISTAYGGPATNSIFTATGDVKVSDISVVGGGWSIAWVFASTPAANGKIVRPVMRYQPPWAFSVAEVLGQDF